MIGEKRNYYRLQLVQNLAVGDKIELNMEDRHYLQTVLRIKVGCTIKVFNENDGEFFAKVMHDKRSTSVLVEQFLRKPPPPRYLNLGFCIVKNSIMPDIIDQAVQLGVSHISPLISVHTNHREFNLERYKKIAKEALEQSNRCDSVEILPPIPLEAFVSQAFDLMLFANETEKEKNLLNIQTWPEKLALLIGPEGGFSQSEIAYLCSNARSISLGENILKAPTACTALLAQISLLRSNTSRLN